MFANMCIQGSITQTDTITLTEYFCSQVGKQLKFVKVTYIYGPVTRETRHILLAI